MIKKQQGESSTFSSCFIRETRRELVVLVRSVWGIFNPLSMAYKRPEQTNHNYKQIYIQIDRYDVDELRLGIRLERYSNRRREDRASATHQLVVNRVVEALPVHFRFPYSSSLSLLNVSKHIIWVTRNELFINPSHFHTMRWTIFIKLFYLNWIQFTTFFPLIYSTEDLFIMQLN